MSDYFKPTAKANVTKASPLAFFFLMLIFSPTHPTHAAESSLPKAKDKQASLPASFHGAWNFEKSSGGFTGRGDSSYKIERIVFTAKNVLEEYKDGKLVRKVSFTVKKGKTLFSKKEEWIIEMPKSLPKVTRIIKGKLHLADNVTDGFSYSYVRPKKKAHK